MGSDFFVAQRSKLEKKIIRELKEYGYSAVHSHTINRKVYDIYIPALNMLIEFNGDYWHCNPKQYAPAYFNVKKNMTAKQIWALDAEKENLAKKNGYNFLVIWESDYRKQPKIIIKKIIQKNGRKRIHHVRKRPING